MEIKNGGRPIRQKLQVLSYLSPPQKKANFRFVKNFFSLINRDRKIDRCLIDAQERNKISKL